MANTPLLTYQEIAQATKCSMSSIRRWVACKELPVIKLGHNTRRVRQSDFDSFLQRRITR
uniref:DNA binding domain excisionase family protein n=1 Tax=uncultured Planctomycetota bacterium TaxID=120965 RepID=A0A1B0Z241_9BACT|nr:DNA binding domain excisionase family protein [uncultured Planctomycetota bacterium]